MNQPSPDSEIPYFRTTLSLPAEQAQMLNHLAKLLGCSQSLLVSVLLDDVLPVLDLGAQSLLRDRDVPARRAGGPHVLAVSDLVRDLVREGHMLNRQGSLL